MNRRSLILFVCSGNTCRSVMAEHLLRKHLEAVGLPVQVESAGLWAAEGEPASAHVRVLLRRDGLDVTGHRSRLLTEGQVDEAGLIVVMTEAHRRSLLDRFPQAEGKIRLLKEYDGYRGWGDLDDPLGGDWESYERIRTEIERALPELVMAAHELFQAQERGRE